MDTKKVLCGVAVWIAGLITSMVYLFLLGRARGSLGTLDAMEIHNYEMMSWIFMAAMGIVGTALVISGLFSKKTG